MGRREKLGSGLFRWFSVIMKNYSEEIMQEKVENQTRSTWRDSINEGRSRVGGNLKEGYFRNMVDGSRAATMDAKVEIYSHLSW